jgi:hypothetical protein
MLVIKVTELKGIQLNTFLKINLINLIFDIYVGNLLI